MGQTVRLPDLCTGSHRRGFIVDDSAGTSTSFCYHPASAVRAADGPRKGFNPPPDVSFIHLRFLAPTADHGRLERNGGVPMPEQSEQPSGLTPLPLPDSPDLDWLRKQAKHRL